MDNYRRAKQGWELQLINTEELKKEYDRLLQLSKKIDDAMKNAPEGTLYFRYYKHKTIPYISVVKKKKRVRVCASGLDPQEIYRIAMKTYAKHIKRRVNANLAAMRSAVKYHPFDTNYIQFGGDGFALCREHFFGKTAFNAEFDAIPERQNPAFPEQLNVKTELGIFRSREEYILARALSMLGLQFKYETAVNTPYGIRYPDFAVLHPVTGKIIYIEYAGSYASEKYQQSVVLRLRDYMSAGIFPGINLFYLASDPDGGIDQAAIINMLKGIFGICS